MLQRLCDTSAGESGATGESAVLLVDDGSTPQGGTKGIVLSQGGVNTPRTPLRVPSVLTLFRTPPPPTSVDDGDDDQLNQSLRVRVMKGRNGDGAGRLTPVGRSYKSCMSWAPDDLSPVTYTSPVVSEPVLGPTLGLYFDFNSSALFVVSYIRSVLLMVILFVVILYFHFMKLYKQ